MQHFTPFFKFNLRDDKREIKCLSKFNQKSNLGRITYWKWDCLYEIKTQQFETVKRL